MGIKDYVTLILRTLLYSTVVFTLNPLLQIYRQLFLSLLFVAQKVTKRHSAEQNQLSQPLLTNFRWAKISLGRLLLASNFPLIVAGVRSLAALLWRVRKHSHSFPRLSAAVAIINSNGNIKDQPAPLNH